MILYILNSDSRPFAKKSPTNRPSPTPLDVDAPCYVKYRHLVEPAAMEKIRLPILILDQKIFVIKLSYHFPKKVKTFFALAYFGKKYCFLLDGKEFPIS